MIVSLTDLMGIQAPAQSKDTLPVTIGASLPPVPGKLVKWIEAGYFVEMGELLPKRLGAANVGTDDEGFKAPRPKPSQSPPSLNGPSALEFM